MCKPAENGNCLAKANERSTITKWFIIFLATNYTLKKAKLDDVSWGLVN